MSKKLLIKILTLAVIFALAGVVNIMPALADGGIFPPPDYYVYETGQEAAIFFDNGREILIVKTDFRGEAGDFGWVIPVPSRPEISKGSDEILENLRQIVAVRYQQVGILESPMQAGYKSWEDAVTVIESKKIDYLEAVVLTATDAQALAKWLQEKGYQYPEDSSWILNDYIQNQWFFVAVKVSPEAENAPDVVQGLADGHITPLKIEFETKTPVYPLRISGIEISGREVKLSDNLTLTPAQVSHLEKIGYSDLTDRVKGPAIFNQIVNDMIAQLLYERSAASRYPLIITRQDYTFPLGSSSQGYVDSREVVYRRLLEGLFRNYFSRQGIRDSNYYSNRSMPINLYVITNYKVEATAFTQKYGNWIKKDKIEKLATDFSGNPMIQPAKDKYFLTHLYRYMKPSEMAQLETDLFLKPASDNDLVNAIELKGTIIRFWATVGIALAVLIGCVIVLIIWLKKPPKK